MSGDRGTGGPPLSALADVLALRGLDGWLTPPLLPVVPAAGFTLGPAVTVRFALDDGGRLGPLQEVLSGDLAGAIVVVAGASDLDGAVWGEILTAAAVGRGAAGVLVDGAVRDRRAMLDQGLPVFARGEALVGPRGLASVVAVGEPVEVAGVGLAPGDLVALDGSGALRLPLARADELLADALAYAEAEDRVVTALRAGAPLTEAYREKADVVARLQMGRSDTPAPHP